MAIFFHWLFESIYEHQIIVRKKMPIDWWCLKLKGSNKRTNSSAHQQPQKNLHRQPLVDSLYIRAPMYDHSYVWTTSYILLIWERIMLRSDVWSLQCKTSPLMHGHQYRKQLLRITRLLRYFHQTFKLSVNVISFIIWS